MRKKQKFISVYLFLLAIIIFSSNSHAQPGVGIKVGTLGAGVDLTLPLSSYVATRFNLNYISFELESTREGVTYNVPVSMKTFGALVDLHPFRGVFHLTAGMVLNQNSVKINANGKETVTLDDTDYEGDFELEGELLFRKMAPYLGIGWSPSLKRKSKWGFSADIGVMFQGTPRIKAAASGSATNTSTGETIDNVFTDSVFLNDLNNEVMQIQEDIDDSSFSRFYPVASFGLIFQF